MSPHAAIRPEIASSWRRTSECGLDPGATVDPQLAVAIDPHSRLLRAAGPVLDELAGALSGAGYALILADREARLVDVRVGAPALRPVLERIGAVVGGSFTESTTGTNSIATAFEVRRGIAVHGNEHYLDSFKPFACYGSPVLDPLTGRIAGVLDITCRAEDASELLRPFLLRGARDIEAGLLEDAGRTQRSLLSEFQAAARRSTEPLVAFGADLVLTNTAATDLLQPADQAALQILAAEMSRAREASRRYELDLTTGSTTAATLSLVDGGVLVRLQRVSRTPAVPRRRARAADGDRDDWHAGLRAEIERCVTGKACVLVHGEPGTGLGTVAARLVPGAVPEVVGATATVETIAAAAVPADGADPGTWLVTNLHLREPIGVVGAIVPWNFPQTLAFFKVAPALAAGCTLVVKPSPETVLDSVLLAEAAIGAGLPAGVLNIVPGGREVGAHLVEHPDVDKIAFTGSTAAGRQIAETCGRLLRPVTLELGGKSAAVVLDDAELDLATIGTDLFVATLANNGQTCFLGTRVLAPRSRYAEVVDVFPAFAGSMAVGDSLDPATQIGPMASERQRERVEGYIAKGRAEGGRITVGGGRPQGRDAGWFVQPTVFADVDTNATIAQEEIFGPVLTVIAYEDEADAIRIANDSAFGLGGTVWTADPERGAAVAERIQTGTVGVNRYLPDPAAPFGGVKASGIGRELGPEGLANYQHLKSVYL